MKLRRSPRKHISAPRPIQISGFASKNRLSKKQPGRPGLRRSRQWENPRKGASLEMLPLDILYEILLDMDPQDLVNISRTCQALHAVLYRRSTRFIWQRALDRIEAPPCPPDLIEARYSAFLFGNACDYCFKKKREDSLQILWGSRTKVCRSCANSDQFIRAKLGSATHNDPLFNMVSTVQFPRDRYICVHKEEYEHLRLQRDSLVSENEREAWMEAQKQAFADLMKLCWLIRSWMTCQDDEQEEELGPIVEARLRSFGRRIRAVAPGLEDEIYFLEMNNGLDNIHGLLTPQKLTTQEWNKLKPSVLKSLEKARSERLDDNMCYQLYKFADDYKDYLEHYHLAGRLPSAADVATQPEFCDLLESPPRKTPCYFMAMEDDFPEICSRWPSKLDDDLLLIMKKSCPSATLGDLHSPSTTFNCFSCDRLLHYPGVLDHHCLTARRGDGDRLTRMIWKEIKEAPWNPASLVYWPRISALAAQWMVQIGTQMTIEELLDVPLFECFSCSKKLGSRFVRTWDGMLRAHHPHTKKNHGVVQISLDKKEQERKTTKIRNLVEKSHLRRRKLFVCSACHHQISASEIWSTAEDGGRNGLHKCSRQKRRARSTRSDVGNTYHRHPDFVPALSQADFNSICRS